MYAVNLEDSSICETDNQGVGVIISIRSVVDGSIVSLCPTSDQKGVSRYEWTWDLGQIPEQHPGTRISSDHSVPHYYTHSPPVSLPVPPSMIRRSSIQEVIMHDMCGDRETLW